MVLAVVVAVLVTGCGGFEREWQRAMADYRSGPVGAPAGPWEGGWRTSNNGHSGKLRAVVRPVAGKPGVFLFRYHATWGISAGTFEIECPVVVTGKRVNVAGEKEIPMFGSFRHSGVISGQTFEATFSGEEGDVGKFSLRRPEVAEAGGNPDTRQ